ncbi:nonstructural protein [Sigmofec virus UA08Rod_6451]|uniref:Nonstructural protein n=1 Tax=Sigmofec virus UA08Rod_6451 TaxID=2929230 RepID=A0A976N1P2_9VIRU|nr:nonstructural protein [Sigmofec virus UA08Rod_6451]
MLLVSQLYDFTSSSYLPPTYFKNYSEFIRALIDDLRNDKFSLKAFPNDFAFLFQYKYDESTGLFDYCDKAVAIRLVDLLSLIYVDVEKNIFRSTQSIVDSLFSSTYTFSAVDNGVPLYLLPKGDGSITTATLVNCLLCS